MKKSRTARYILMSLLLVFMLTTLSGCFGTPEPNRNHINTPYDEGIEIVGQRVLVVWKDRITSLDASGRTPTSAKRQGLWTVHLPVDVNNGIEVSPLAALPRDLAITLYNSVFNDNYDNSADQYSKTDFGKFLLDPHALIQKVNTQTMTLLDGNNALSDIVSTVQAVAVVILIAVWSMNFISQIINERFTMEALLKTLMQLMCGVLLIVCAEDLVQAFADVGNALVRVVGGDSSAVTDGAAAAGSSRGQFADFANEIKGLLTQPIPCTNIGFHLLNFDLSIGSFWVDIQPLWAIVLMLAPFVTQFMCAYKIISIMITRMIELTVRITLAPIPLAFSAQNGFSQESIRYFRGVLACAMQPVLMLIGTACTGAIASAILAVFGLDGQPVTGIVGSLAMAFSYLVLSAYLGETKHLAQEIIAR